MAVREKRLFQGALSSSLTALVTGAASKVTTITQIWVTLTSATPRTIMLTAFGTAAANELMHGQGLYAGETKIIDAKIVLEASEVFYMKQDTGTDVTVTIFGVQADV